MRVVFSYAQLYKAAKLGYSSLPSLVYFGNMFWCSYFGILFAIFFFLGQEPLAGFHRNHPENYLVFQFLKAALFLGHFLLCLLLAVFDLGQGRLLICRVMFCVFINLYKRHLHSAVFFYLSLYRCGKRDRVYLSL